jgi:hypothetical protein
MPARQCDHLEWLKILAHACPRESSDLSGRRNSVSRIARGTGWIELIADLVSTPQDLTTVACYAA